MEWRGEIGALQPFEEKRKKMCQRADVERRGWAGRSILELERILGSSISWQQLSVAWPVVFFCFAPSDRAITRGSIK